MPASLPRTNLEKGLHALAHGMRHPRALATSLQRSLVGLYRDRVFSGSPIPTVPVQSLLGPSTVVQLQACAPRDGNVTLAEMLAITGLVRERGPRVVVEIGTFDGNTTLQIARNAPADATVFTLDLPADPGGTAGALAAEDLAYIHDRAKHRRRYEGTDVAARITQWLGDSMTFDFAGALGGRGIDLAFIDGSHSREYVASDTRRILPLLAPHGLVLWHDYAPVWPGVMEFLDELSTDLPLRRIEGTALVLLDRTP